MAVNRAECTALLQWALPRLGLRWRGFRKVRRQVCRRISRRVTELDLADAEAYRTYLEAHPAELSVLDSFCRITISRFYRDRAVFDGLASSVLPELARLAQQRGENQLRAWSAGCASGEEPYSLVVLWRLVVAPQLGGMRLRITATDVDDGMLDRARRGSYEQGSFKDLPVELWQQAFREDGNLWVLRDEFRSGVELRCQDVRREHPDGPFDLILCRNLVLTYFEEPLQREVLAQLVRRLAPAGALMIGGHESLPVGLEGLEPDQKARCVYRKRQ